MSTNQINWVEIPVNDMARAKEFYAAVFNYEFNDMTMGGIDMAIFPWIPGAPNASGALVKGDNYQPSNSGTKIYFQCEDLNTELKRVEENGGQVILPKTSLGDFGNMGLIIDTEGNVVGLHSNQ